LVTKGIIKPYVFIKDLFYLVAPHQNDGIAFGIDIPMPVQILGSLVILYFVFKIGTDYFSGLKKPPALESYLLGAVIGGGLGNLIDRVWHGYVVDFIVLGPIPIFNVADIGITVGLLALFGTMWASNKKQI